MKSDKQQVELAQQNNFFDKTFLSNQMKDRSLADGFLNNAMSQARKTALIMGGTMVIALIAVVYAFVQDTIANEELRKKEAVIVKYSQCENELEKQKAIAQESALIEEEVTRMAEEQLQACQSKK